MHKLADTNTHVTTSKPVPREHDCIYVQQFLLIKNVSSVNLMEKAGGECLLAKQVVHCLNLLAGVLPGIAYCRYTTLTRDREGFGVRLGGMR